MHKNQREEAEEYKKAAEMVGTPEAKKLAADYEGKLKAYHKNNSEENFESVNKAGAKLEKVESSLEKMRKDAEKSEQLAEKSEKAVVDKLKTE